MANVDGSIVLGLDIQKTSARIQADIDKILGTTKVRQIVLKAAIEKSETEKSIKSLISDINNKTIELGIEVDAKDVHGILAEQQKIASTQANLNRQMDEYRKIAKDIGITLNKSTWNGFNQAIKSENFSKAKEILKSAKQQIDEYYKSVKKMNEDTSITRSASSMIDKFGQLQNVSEATRKRVDLLKANLKQFETADSTKAKLSAYNRLKTSIENLTTELVGLQNAEKNYAHDGNIQSKFKDAESLYESFSKLYSTADGQAGNELKTSLQELGVAISSFKENSKGLSGGKLEAEYNKVDEAVQKVTRSVREYKAEQSSSKSLNSGLESLTKNIEKSLGSLGKSKASNDGIAAFKSGLIGLQQEAQNLSNEFAALDFGDGDAVNRFSAKLDSLIAKYKELEAAEKASAQRNTFDEKIRDAQSYLQVLKNSYSAIGNGAGAEKVKAAISALETALDNVAKNPTEEQVATEWNKVDEAVQKAVRSVKEYNAAQKTLGGVGSELESLIKKIDESKNRVDGLNSSDLGAEQLRTKLGKLRQDAALLKDDLISLDPSDPAKIEELRKNIEKLVSSYQKLGKDVKVFGDVNEFEKFRASVEKAQQKIRDYANTYSAIKTRPDLVKELKQLQEASENIFTPEDFVRYEASVSKFETKVKSLGLHCKSWGDKLKDAFSNFAQFFSASRAIYEVIQMFKNMVSAIKEIDAAMIELRKVTDETEYTYTKFLTNAKSKAVELGTTIKELVNASADFNRMGFSFEESEKLAEIATIYANVGDDVNSIDEATSIIITAMKAFNLEADEAFSIIDKLNSIGNEYAISSGNLGEGLTRAASYLSTAGNSIDETLAMLTAMAEITQDASESGNALKILAMRLRGAATEITKAGESTDGMAESTSKLREKILALTNVSGKGGFDIMASPDEFKSTYEIMQGIASVWSDMNNIDQAKSCLFVQKCA